ncbi:hypothetical protein [uncultured Gimesia sp.]|uniref:hypothetical protein n=1 Tax=uncultured Gimesia sp. TaxID=1678688 RepID=UPI0030DAB993|tara:strand:+ start:106184 stop:106660 length:477 start_codon:yes stop_codon:yes gene_type:complete
MNRRIVSLILIPFVLLTQSVTFGHSHTGNQPAGHGLHAHIHVNSSAVDEHHGHVHQHGTHSHEHQNDSHSDRDKQNSSQMESPFDHDSSAVYLNSADLTAGSRSTLKIDLSLFFQWSIIGTDALACSLFHSKPEWNSRDCAPPGPDTPLFVRHHAFLI